MSNKQEVKWITRRADESELTFRNYWIYEPGRKWNGKSDNTTPHHIYILDESDRVYPNNYCYRSGTKTVVKYTGEQIIYNGPLNGLTKIIATNDPKLITDGVPHIGKEFLKSFVDAQGEGKIILEKAALVLPDRPDGDGWYATFSEAMAVLWNRLIFHPNKPCEVENEKPELKIPLMININPIRWDSRYSTTMEDDEQGRWARVAFAGHQTEMFIDNKAVHFQIAWISKLKYVDKTVFTVKPSIPYNNTHAFPTLEEAMQAVEEAYKWFITQCTTGYEATIGVGSGDGNLFVHGDHKSIMVLQAKLLELERLRQGAVIKNTQA